MSVAETFRYANQLRNYIVQFAAIFQGMEVQIGKLGTREAQTIPVIIKNASSDRVVAALKADNTQNKVIRLPLMTYQLTSIELAPERRIGTGAIRRNAYVPTGGLVPNDITVIEQRMPVPYNAIFELTLWASNHDQYLQMLEQILLLFDPTLQIQISDDIFDWSKITTVELLGINSFEGTTPGVDNRMVQGALTFNVGINIQVSAIEHKRIVQDIYLRLGVISNNIDNMYDALTELDDQNVVYEKVATAPVI